MLHVAVTNVRIFSTLAAKFPESTHRLVLVRYADSQLKETRGAEFDGQSLLESQRGAHCTQRHVFLGLNREMRLCRTTVAGVQKCSSHAIIVYI